jgi:hypothetical protein
MLTTNILVALYHGNLISVFRIGARHSTVLLISLLSMRLAFHAAGLAFHFALVFLREAANDNLLSVNQLLRHIQSKGLQGNSVLFSLTVSNK